MSASSGGSGAPAAARGGLASRWLAGLARLPRLRMAWAVAAPLLSGLLLLPQAWWLAQVLGATAGGSAPIAAGPWLAAIGGLIVLRAALAWSGERAASHASEAIKSWLRRALFARILARGPQWTRHKVSGELASLVVEQVEALDGYFTRYLPGAIAAVFLPLAFGIVLLPVDWIVALILLLSAPLIPVFMALVGWGAEAASRRHQLAMTRLSGIFADRVRGALTLKLLGRARSETAAMGAASADLSRKTMAVLRIAFLSSAVLEFFAALGVAGVALYVGLSYLGYLHPRGEALGLPLGLFCLLMAPEVYNPLRQFAANYHDRAAARAAVDGLVAVFETLPDPQGPGAGMAVVSAAGSQAGGGPAKFGQASPSTLEVRQLALRAPGRERAVLEGFSCTLASGGSLALMGRSGAGKTTLVEALAGLREVAAGEILLGGRPLQAWPPADLRRAVTLIGQRPFILPGTVADNLRLADAHAPREALLRALEAACAGEFVQALPQGLDTPLGTHGYGLSGGQLHRLALARLFLTQPSLILLDEPTTSLDPRSRDRVLQAVLEFAKGRMLVLATHDSEVARMLDRTLSLHGDGAR